LVVGSQELLKQSLLARQVRAPAHLPQVPPPQSTSVSAPSFTPFSQGKGAQVPPRQVVLSQSAPEPQRRPTEQGRQVSPPQSTSLSVPLRIWSSHFGFM
jgi:hypothetical protein